MNRTGVAVVGLGNIGAVHLRNLQSLRGCTLAGIFDLHADLCAQSAADYGCRAFASFDELLSAEDVSAVLIATPAASHRLLSEAALSAGKHVFVEKPLADTFEDAEALAEAAHRHPKLCLQVGFCERFNAQYLEAKRAIHSGALGEVRAIYSTRVAPLELGDPVWALGVLDTAVHNLDLILHLSGWKPQSVRAQGVALYPDILPAIQSVIVTLAFANGALATDQITWQRTGPHPLRQCARSRMQIFGTDGTFEIDLTARPASLATAGSFQMIDTVILGAPDYYSGLKLQLEAFLHSVETGAPSAVPAAEALETERVAIAAAQSLKDGEEIAL